MRYTRARGPAVVRAWVVRRPGPIESDPLAVVHQLLDAVSTVGSDLDPAVDLGRIIHRAVALVDASYGALGVLDETGTHRGQAIDRIAEAVDDLDLTIKQIRMAIFDLERTRDASEGCAAGSSVSSTSRSEGSVSSRGSCSMARSTPQPANTWRRSWCPPCVRR